MYYCDKCGKPATNLTWVEINGRRMEQHLCADCAQKERGLDELIEPMVGEFFDFPVAFARKKPSKHMSSSFGYFPKMFNPYINSYYDDTPMPIEKVKLNVKKPSEYTRLDNLKAQLQKAVNEERFNDAAELKKQIDELKERGEK